MPNAELFVLLNRRQLRVVLVIAIFFLAHTGFWLGVNLAAAESLDSVRAELSRLDKVQAVAASEFSALKSQVDDNTRTLSLLTKTSAELAAKIETLSTVGVGIGGVGGLLTLLQGWGLLQKRKEPREQRGRQ